MAKPFKFKYVNELTGGLVLLAALLLVAAVLIAGRAQQWFEPVLTIETTFPIEGSSGIKRGAEVVVLGTPVGRVEQVDVEEDGTVFATLSVVGDFARFVREDSVAVIKKKFEVAGDAYIEISRGTGRRLADGDEIGSRRDTALTEKVNELIERLEEKTLPLLEEVELLIVRYRELAESITDDRGRIQQTLEEVKLLIHEVRTGDGPVPQLLSSKEMADKVDTQVDRIDRILANIEATTDVLPETARVVGGEVQSAEGVTREARAALEETRVLLDGLQRHWLLRKYMQDTEQPEHLDPSRDLWMKGGRRAQP